MKILIALFVIYSSFCFGEVGKITKVIGDGAYIMRGGQKIDSALNADLQLNDELHSENAYMVIYLYPGTQMSVSKNSSVKISEHLIEESNDLEKASSVIDYIKGIIRLQVTKDANQLIEQKVQARGVAFGVRGTEFEVSEEGDEIELDVIEGEVEVTSPDVKTFVPEIVKRNEGFRFNRKKPGFARKKFRQRFQNHPGFEKPENLKAKWKELRKLRKQKRAERAERREERRQKRNKK